MRPFLASCLFSLALPLSAATELAVFTPQRPERVPAGQQLQAVFTVWNFGPDSARNAVVELETSSPDVQVSRVVTNSQASCNYETRPVRCALGDLPVTPNPGLTFIVVLTTPLRNAHVSVVARVSSATEDVNASNNSVSFGYTIVDAVNLSLRAEFATARVDPGTTVVARAEITNFLDTYPSQIRAEFTVENGTIIDIIEPEASGFTCTVTSPTTGFCTAPELNRGCRCSRPFEVLVRTSPDRAGGLTRLMMKATTSLPEFHDVEERVGIAEAQTYRIVPVLNTNDSGAGSLRSAIDTANAECGEAPCKIAFEIARSSGMWQTISPQSPLPTITARRVFVDGGAQTRLSGDTNPNGPEVAIDGSATRFGHGLQIESPCEAIVHGLTIGNFADHGIFTTKNAPCVNGTFVDIRSIEFNHLGVDPAGTAAWPNLRGIVADGETGAVIRHNVIGGNRRSGIWMHNGSIRILNNRIGTSADGKSAIPNGASGIFLGAGVTYADVFLNRVANHPQMGVAVDGAAKLVDVRENSMSDNGGLGIDIGLDGPNPPWADDRDRQANPPVLLSARYDSSRDATIVMVSTRTSNLGPYGNTAIVSIYANSEPDEDGEQHLRAETVRNRSGETFEVMIAGDYRGRWLNATNTRVHFIALAPPDRQKGRDADFYAGGEAQTSEFSNSVLVQ